MRGKMQLNQNLTILVVEDEPDLLEMITVTFSAFGLKVLKAKDAKRACEILQINPVDIVVTDVGMPKKTGLELLKWIRLKNIDTPKVFFMTGVLDFSSDEIFEYGADGLFLKPFNTRTVLDALRKCVLTQEERWSIFPILPPVTQINLTFSRVAFTIEGEFRLSRGGFFIQLGHIDFKLNDLISFELVFSDPVKNLKMIGTGYVKWILKEPTNLLPKVRVGVEISYLEGSCRKEIIEWTQKNPQISYIPNR